MEKRTEKEQIGLGIFKMNFLGRFDSCCMSLLEIYQIAKVSDTRYHVQRQSRSGRTRRVSFNSKTKTWNFLGNLIQGIINFPRVFVERIKLKSAESHFQVNV